jgi:hypothetical protein
MLQKDQCGPTKPVSYSSRFGVGHCRAHSSATLATAESGNVHRGCVYYVYDLLTNAMDLYVLTSPTKVFIFLSGFPFATFLRTFQSHLHCPSSSKRLLSHLIINFSETFTISLSISNVSLVASALKNPNLHNFQKEFLCVPY